MSLRDDRELRANALKIAQKSGMLIPSKQLIERAEEIYKFLKGEDDKNTISYYRSLTDPLIQHALRELVKIGEEEFIILHYLRVIEAFSNMGDMNFPTRLFIENLRELLHMRQLPEIHKL